MPVNQYAKNIESIYSRYFKKNELNDLNCYLYGMALKALEKKEQAIEAFIQALNLNPFLWTAWVELCLIICHDYDFSDGLEYLAKIDDHWMKNVYFACLMLENLKIQKKYENYAFGAVIGLFCFFRESVFLMNQLAHIFYHNQDQ